MQTNIIKLIHLIAIFVLFFSFSLPLFSQEDGSDINQPKPLIDLEVPVIHLSGGELGEGPVAITTNPTDNRIAVANQISNSINVIDGDSNQIFFTIPIEIDNSVSNIAENVETGIVYVAVLDTTDIEVLDTATGLVLDVIKLDHIPSSIDVDPINNRVFITNKEAGLITVVDGILNEIIGSLVVGRQAGTILVNPLLDLLYVGGFNSNIMSIIDINKNVLIDEVITTFNPSDIEISSLTESVFISESFDNGSIIMMNGRSNEIIGSIKLFDGDEAIRNPFRITGMTINSEPEINSLYVLAENENEDNLFVIDVSDSSIAKRIELVQDEHTIKSNLGNNFVYITNRNSSSLSVIHGIRNKRLFDVGSEFNGEQIIINSRANKVYVTSENNAGVRVIAGDTNYIIDTVTIPVGNSGVGFDRDTNLVYFITDGFLNITDGLTNEIVSESIDVRKPLDGGSENDVTNGKIIVNSNTHRIYIGVFDESNNSGKVKVIDAITNEVINEISIRGNPKFLEIDELKNLIYVVSNTDILVVDGTSDQIVNTINMSSRIEVFGINPILERIYAGGDNRLSVIDSVTTRTITTKFTAENITTIEVNPVNNHVYMGITGKDIVDILDEISLQVVGSIITKTGVEVADIAYNPNTNILYMTNKNTPLLSIIPDDESVLIPRADIAALTVEFDPNPVEKIAIVRNRFEFRVSLNEINGLDVRITDFSIIGDGFAQQLDPAKFIRWFNDCGQQGGGIIPAFDTACAEIVISVRGTPPPTLLWTFNGIDQNDNEIVAQGIIELEFE